MRPLNHCLQSYMARREKDSSSPAWILFHDTDEYIFPVQTNVTISEALMEHSATCCVHVGAEGRLDRKTVAVGTVNRSSSVDYITRRLDTWWDVGEAERFGGYVSD